MKKNLVLFCIFLAGLAAASTFKIKPMTADQIEEMDDVMSLPIPSTNRPPGWVPGTNAPAPRVFTYTLQDLGPTDAPAAYFSNTNQLVINCNSNEAVFIQTCTNLATPVWNIIGTGTNGSFYDLVQTNYDHEFYRLLVVSPHYYFQLLQSPSGDYPVVCTIYPEWMLNQGGNYDVAGITNGTPIISVYSNCMVEAIWPETSSNSATWTCAYLIEDNGISCTTNDLPMYPGATGIHFEPSYAEYLFGLPYPHFVEAAPTNNFLPPDLCSTNGSAGTWGTNSIFYPSPPSTNGEPLFPILENTNSLPVSPIPWEPNNGFPTLPIQVPNPGPWIPWNRNKNPQATDNWPSFQPPNQTKTWPPLD